MTSGTQSVSYGDLVAAGLSRSFTEDELKAIPLKPHADLRLVGRDVTALDIANKTNGRAIYGIDARVGGMVHGVPLLPPTRLGASVASVDDSAAKSVKGDLQTLTLDDPTGIVPGVVVVLGESLMAAKWASAKVEVQWNAGPTADVSEQMLLDHARQLIADDGMGCRPAPGTTGGRSGHARPPYGRNETLRMQQ